MGGVTATHPTDKRQRTSQAAASNQKNKKDAEGLLRKEKEEEERKEREWQAQLERLRKREARKKELKRQAYLAKVEKEGLERKSREAAHKRYQAEMAKQRKEREEFLRKERERIGSVSQVIQSSEWNWWNTQRLKIKGLIGSTQEKHWYQGQCPCSKWLSGYTFNLDCFECLCEKCGHRFLMDNKTVKNENPQL